MRWRKRAQRNSNGSGASARRLPARSTRRWLRRIDTLRRPVSQSVAHHAEQIHYSRKRGEVMGGHSHWATTKRHKASVDAKRGKIFTKIIREITIAARLGGGDPEGNPRLRLAIAKAKDVNMPSDNIKKAIQRGTGELPGIHFEEFQLEGYGPGGCALLIDLTSDNRNRTVAEIRNIFSKQNCNLAEAGAVAWQFHKKGLLVVEKGKVDEDKLMSLALDAGAEDMKADE